MRSSRAFKGPRTCIVQLCVCISVWQCLSCILFCLHVKFVRCVHADSALRPYSSEKVWKYWLSLPFIGMQGSWIAHWLLIRPEFISSGRRTRACKWSPTVPANHSCLDEILEGVSQTNKTTCCAEDGVHTILCNGILRKCRSGGIYNVLTCWIAWTRVSKHKRHVCTKRSRSLVCKNIVIVLRIIFLTLRSVRRLPEVFQAVAQL